MSSEQTFKIIYHEGDEVRFQHSSGAVYTGLEGRCGEAMYIIDANNEDISVIPLVNYGEITNDDIELACTVITAIKLTEELAKFNAKVKVEQVVEVLA